MFHSGLRKKYRIINHIAKYKRTKRSYYHTRCGFCQRFGDGRMYCKSTQYGGGFVHSMCMNINTSCVNYYYVPNPWYVEEKKES